MSQLLEETNSRVIGLTKANDAEDSKSAKIIKSKDKKTCARKNRLPLRSSKGTQESVITERDHRISRYDRGEKEYLERIDKLGNVGLVEKASAWVLETPFILRKLKVRQQRVGVYI